jgi:7-cyano-7-deazaguanine synthase in queuosine biosynthesis
MAKDLAIILNNGGVNSAVTTALAAQKYRPILLYAETAQAEGTRARAAYDQQVAHFKPYREHTLSMPFLAAVEGHRPGPGSAAPSSSASAATADPRQQAPLGPQMIELLPLVATAIRFAAHYQAAAVYLGLRVGPRGDELSQATEYVQVWNELVQMPCGQSELELATPLLELEPWQVVDLGFQVAAPFERTWSCVAEGERGEPCWACRGCRTRESAFQQAAKPDPLRTARRG